jgi:hypothetical protein
MSSKCLISSFQRNSRPLYAVFILLPRQGIQSFWMGKSENYAINLIAVEKNLRVRTLGSCPQQIPEINTALCVRNRGLRTGRESQ